jgi:hypothetical protein
MLDIYLQIYPNFTNPKGLALIINNHRFNGRLPDRLGTDVDEVNVTRLLQQIGYKVKVKRDLHAEVSECNYCVQNYSCYSRK